MFSRRFFGGRMFGPRYFGVGSDAPPITPGGLLLLRGAGGGLLKLRRAS